MWRFFYVGKMKRPFFHCIRDHTSLIHKKRWRSQLAVTLANFESQNMKFFALEHIPPHERGGDNDKSLLQRETKWIYTLSATRYPRLNYAIIIIINMFFHLLAIWYNELFCNLWQNILSKNVIFFVCTDLLIISYSYASCPVHWSDHIVWVVIRTPRASCWKGY